EFDLTEKIFSFMKRNKEEIIAHLKRKEIEFKPEKKKTFYRRLAFGAASLVVIIAIVCSYYFLFLKEPLPLSEKVAQRTRGEPIKIFGPVGQINNLPEFIKWKEVRDANYYLIQLRNSKDQILWSALSHESRIKIPSFVKEMIERGEVYNLKIMAFSQDGRIISESKSIVFSFNPRF
ncbi:hypothetical protein NLC27_03540, partial [Candidatus Aminicenantes bacterium AC-708-I09]|nr:hypothetical protein [Candidatus Aminicenantes bacterium AC-708-I09]